MVADAITRAEIADLTAQLVAIDSTNPSLVAGGAGEGEIATFVGGWLRDHGIEFELHDAAPGRPNVVGVVRGSGGGKSLMLNAHIDTVGAGGMDAPFDPQIKGNRLYGRGAYDMKASLAAIMLTAARTKDAGLSGDLIVTAVADEEYASVGTQAIVKRYKADAAIVTEPTDLAMCLAHKGFVWLDLATHGTAAHGSLPEEGIDAIVKMARVLTGIGELDHRLRAGCPQSLVGTGSVHASLISGGTELSTYPDLCRVHIERRTVPGETPAGVEAEFRQIIAAGAAQDSTFRADLTMGISRDPFHVSETQPIVRLLSEVATTHLGRVPATIGAGGWMDSALLSAAGIPTVIFGPTGVGAHADVEWVDLDSAVTCANILTAVTTAFCG
jgi:acetylornithine deacetylase